MEWISVADRLPHKEGKVLAVYLEQSFGHFSPVCCVAYYDSPSHYEDPEDGEGWKLWIADRPLRLVTHWALLPELPKVAGIEVKTSEEFNATFREELGSLFAK